MKKLLFSLLMMIGVQASFAQTLEKCSGSTNLNSGK